MSSGKNNTDDDRRSEVETDRESLRVEVTPQHARTQLEAAWLIGRLCNELRFRCQNAWLAFGDCEPTRTARIWADLSLLVSDALPMGDVNALTVELQDTRNLWDRRFQSEDHAEELGRDNEVLREHFDNGADLPRGMTSVEFISQAAMIPAEIFSTLHTMFLRNLLEPLRWACRLGCQADQIIHPPSNCRAVRIRRIETTELAHWQLSSRPSPVWVIDQQLDVLESWPDAEWERQIVHDHARFFSSLGIEPARLTRELCRASSAEVLDTLSTDVQDAELLSETEVRNEALENTSRNLTGRGQRTCRRLELTIELRRNEVSRTRVETVSRLAPRLMQLLVHFLNSPEENFTSQWLSENWSRFSPRSPSCSIGTVHAAIGSLNEALEELLVEIRSEENGYVLNDLQRVGDVRVKGTHLCVESGPTWSGIVLGGVLCFV